MYLNFWINMLKGNDLRRVAFPRFGHSLAVIFSPLLLVAISASGEALPPILANQNHMPAGILHDGILTVHLEIAKGVWHPEAEDDIALSLYAFGESGRPLQNPGPLIRVPRGTEIQAWLHNALPVSVAVHGLGERTGDSDAVVRVAPGAVEQVDFNMKTPGLYLYWAATPPPAVLVLSPQNWPRLPLPRAVAWAI
jgi:FtsP/CotA-like multicopper oxidase with cupredoxin domain